MDTPSGANGGHLSRQATNKVNPPGCSVDTSTTTKPDGSVEKRETLNCTKIKVTKASGEVKLVKNQLLNQNRIKLRKH